MSGFLEEASLELVFNAWRRAIRADALLSRVALPELLPFAKAFNDVLVGEGEGELDVTCRVLVRAGLNAQVVMKITTLLAEIFADEIGTGSGAVSRSLVSTLGHVCALLATTMVADVSEEARRDALTGLENRRAYDEAIAALPREGRDAAMAMIDLDGLKAINDGQGHVAGDAHLKRFAVDLRNGVSERALVYRFAGDEYAVLLPGGTTVELDDNLNRIASTSSVSPFSFGVSHTSEVGFEGERLIAAADEKLYMMKAAHKQSKKEEMESDSSKDAEPRSEDVVQATQRRRKQHAAKSKAKRKTKSKLNAKAQKGTRGGARDARDRAR